MIAYDQLQLYSVLNGHFDSKPAGPKLNDKTVKKSKAFFTYDINQSLDRKISISIPTYREKIPKIRVLNQILVKFSNYFRKLIPADLFINDVLQDFEIFYKTAPIEKIIPEIIEIDGLEYEKERRRLRRLNSVKRIRNKDYIMSKKQKLSMLLRFLPKRYPNITPFSIYDMVKAYPQWSYGDLKAQLIAEMDNNPDNDQQFEESAPEYDRDYNTGFAARIRTHDIMNYNQ